MEIDTTPFQHLSLDTIRQTYTYGQLCQLNKEVCKLDRNQLIQYLEDRLNTLEWRHLSLVFIQHTDRYMQTSCAALNWATLVSYVQDESIPVVFYSRTAPDAYRPFPQIPVDWKRVLSNFYSSRIVVDGQWFETPEQAFHGQKILLASSTNRDGGIKNAMTVLLRDSSPLYARRIGGQNSFESMGLLLDTTKWDKIRVDVQRRLITCRIRSDPLFVRVLRWTSNRPLVHFEWGSLRRPPFWGVFQTRDMGRSVGHNMLGNLLMDARSELLLSSSRP